MVGVSISHLVLRKRRNEVPEKAERRLSLCPQAAQLEGGNTENRGISVTTNRHRSNDLLTSNAPLSSLASQKKNALSGP